MQLIQQINHSYYCRLWERPCIDTKVNPVPACVQPRHECEE